MEDTEKRIEALEQKIAALEVEAQEWRKMQSALQEMVDSWEKVLLQFADCYGLDSPEIRKIREKETHF